MESMSMGSHSTLKTKHREVRESHPKQLSVRIHRSLSWLNRAEQCTEEDPDSQFIFLWISFNAAYACETGNSYRPIEHEMYNSFVEKLYKLDKDKKLDKLVWDDFSHKIRVLLKNHHVFQPFWDHLGGSITETMWREKFSNANNAANKAIGSGDTAKVISIVLARLYTLRNQLIHGGATWNSGVNRSQINDSNYILAQLVPIFIEIMMNNPDELWGQPCYPVTQS